ncbi:hypothetical protein [Calothrix sp. NIES-3974]|uniref:hypothetical protein n=1 Tax=Calothrix sp. NIES-3974 TaxID=2005462 RepID=UPI0012FD6461|nr:hypothetical protein [Calothrix sp. NIES-3974]
MPNLYIGKKYFAGDILVANQQKLQIYVTVFAKMILFPNISQISNLGNSRYE